MGGGGEQAGARAGRVTRGRATLFTIVVALGTEGEDYTGGEIQVCSESFVPSRCAVPVTLLPWALVIVLFHASLLLMFARLSLSVYKQFMTLPSTLSRRIMFCALSLLRRRVVPAIWDLVERA